MANLILDYDGTLHESIHIYAPAFRKAQDYLVANGLAQPRQYSNEEIFVWLGFTANEMWNLFSPQLSEKEKNICSKIIGDHILN
ncbi:MAG: hypothetical protein GX833_03605 [Clostridium sp.]|jgi:phosphoglycolate phosphatase|nr:hypothetical protein [Clostridium sp.]